MILIYILVAIALAVIAGVVLLQVSDEGYGEWYFAAYLCGFILLTAAGLTSVCFAFASYNWMAADTKASILNREYGTHYTQKEVYFGSDVIDTIRELDRKRVEVNGDLFREQPAKAE